MSATSFMDCQESPIVARLARSPRSWRSWSVLPGFDRSRRHGRTQCLPELTAEFHQQALLEAVTPHN